MKWLVFMLLIAHYSTPNNCVGYHVDQGILKFLFNITLSGML
jgi:hypothetical protein